MAPDKEIVVYDRTRGCPFSRIARRILKEHQIEFREIMIDKDSKAKKRVKDWTGFESIPTVIVANPGEDLPYQEPAPLERGTSPRGIDRGSMITEANSSEFEKWLRKHGFIGE